MGIATGEVSNNFPTSMVLDDQIFGMSVVAQHHLESRREILTSDRVDDDASLSMVSSAPATPEPIPVPLPVTSPLSSSYAENIPPACCSNPLPPCAPLVPIEEVMSDAEDLDTIAERMEEALDEEVALGFLNWNNQGRGARCQAVCFLLHHSHPYAHQMQPGDHRPRRSGDIFDCLTSNRPASIATLNNALEGMSPHQRDHPIGGNYNIVLDGLPDGWNPQGVSSVASSSSFVPLVFPGRSDCQ